MCVYRPLINLNNTLKNFMATTHSHYTHGFRGCCARGGRAGVRSDGARCKRKIIGRRFSKRKKIPRNAIFSAGFRRRRGRFSENQPPDPISRAAERWQPAAHTPPPPPRRVACSRGSHHAPRGPNRRTWRRRRPLLAHGVRGMWESARVSPGRQCVGGGWGVGREVRPPSRNRVRFYRQDAPPVVARRVDETIVAAIEGSWRG